MQSTDFVVARNDLPHCKLIETQLPDAAALADDYLAENEMFGAKGVMLSSASSKTAFGLAHLLHARGNIKVIGLTSASNIAFVQSLGCYDEVVTYDHLTSLPANTPVAYVDM